MCGIYGIVGLGQDARADQASLRRMGDVIVHRGPDDHGGYVEPRIAFGMRRLSIIDVGGGHQPIENEDGSLVVVCNGEIYNFRELRAELEAAGHRFKTHSDTEIILHLYEQEGDRFLDRLDGMYALALWDKRRQRLIVARDALGIKPVYYAEQGGRLIFASESKSILALPGFEARLDRGALRQYLSVGYVAGPQSMFAGIRKLPPGTAIFVEGSNWRLHRFWRLAPGVDTSKSLEDWIPEVRDGIKRSVRAQMVADVPIGAFLSGGIDSSAVVAAMAEVSSRPVKTYSIGFKGSSGAELYNELPYARRVAELFGTDHREIVVQPNVAELLPELVWHLDEPMADAAFITTYLVSKFARQDVTVILSGVGGDELFGGYKRYLDAHWRSRYRMIPSLVRRGLIDPVARRLPSDRHSKLLNSVRLMKAFVLADALPFDERYRAFMEVFDATTSAAVLKDGGAPLDDCIARAFADSGETDEIRRLMDVDLATQMPEDLLALTDRMSMAVSLECRVPLLDQQLVQMASRIPGEYKMKGGELKHLMKLALKGTLPDDILYRAKRGFGAPIGAWFRRELAPLVRHVLSPEALERRGLLQSAEVARIVREHDQQQSDRTDHLLALLNLEIWARMYLDGESPAQVTDGLRASLAA
jgi:asparagine synthase (glutamine-hydrolysing)